MEGFSKLVFDTANSLNKTYLEGMNQGKKMEVEKMNLKELLNRAVYIADDTGQFQRQLLLEITDFVSDCRPKSPGGKSIIKDWIDFRDHFRGQLLEVE